MYVKYKYICDTGPKGVLHFSLSLSLSLSHMCRSSFVSHMAYLWPETSLLSLTQTSVYIKKTVPYSSLHVCLHLCFTFFLSLSPFLRCFFSHYYLMWCVYMCVCMCICVCAYQGSTNRRQAASVTEQRKKMQFNLISQTDRFSSSLSLPLSLSLSLSP